MNRIGFYASVLIAGTFLAALPPALANEWEIPRTGQKNQSKDFCGRSSCVRRPPDGGLLLCRWLQSVQEVGG